jgi:serine/threonine-protein kinase RsbW
MYATAAKPDGLTMRFSATLNNVDTACDEVGKMLTSRRADKSAFATELIIREALNNAVLHGSRGDAAKTVECSVRFEEEYLVIEVNDQGDGFGWRSAIRETTGTAALSGRGLPIMKAYAAEVSFNEKGNGLLLRVSLPKEEAV